MPSARYNSILLMAAWLTTATAVPADVQNMPSGLLSLETVLVDHPGNAPDDNGRGAVAYSFKIGKYEVTAAQYVEFLNAKAKADADGGLWNNDMDSTRSGEGVRCEIRREGEKGSYRHSVAHELANRPVTHVSFLDARMRNIKVLVQLAGWYGAHLRGDAVEIERQRQWTLAMRDHPALFGYQLYDEPEYKAVAAWESKNSSSCGILSTAFAGTGTPCVDGTRSRTG